VDKLRSIAREVSDLVLEFGGAMSGEHGDGLARSAWNRKLFGEEVYQAFLTIKRAFDPDDRFNPGKVVAEPVITDHWRLSPDYHAHEPATTAFDFATQGGFARAVEMCSGVGACRKTTTGTMCPSYMVTRDEEHSTRGRANLLRLVMSGQLPADGLRNPSLSAALDLCLQCKACKSECPSNVDMAKLKAEVLHQTYRSAGRIPLSALLMGNIHRLNPIGAALAPVANRLGRSKLLRQLMEYALGIDHRRALPTFYRDHFRRWFARHIPPESAGRRGEVVLLDDCFTTYNDPSPGIAAVELLEASGYRVRLADIGCCGRAAISKGLLDTARSLARDAVAKLAPWARQGVPILGVEPSCLVTLIDEYRDFRLGPDSAIVASACRLADSFLADQELVPDLPLESMDGATLLLHGHCHQKATVGTAGTIAALKRIPGAAVRELDSGCCGMAGSFGYDHHHYDVSVALANRVILPALEADPNALLVAPGYSCRSQVHGLSGREALHPLELIRGRLP
jgi:Fe-S oxidoreductase